jgi:hypothetical protein
MYYDKTIEDMRQINRTHPYIDTTAMMTNFDLHFGWMMDRRAELNVEYNDGLINDEMDLIDPDDALAYADTPFEAVEEVLCAQLHYEHMIESGAYEPYDPKEYEWEDD